MHKRFLYAGRYAALLDNCSLSALLCSEEADPPDTGAGGGKPVKPETFSREYVTELRNENKTWREKHQAAEAEKAAALKAVEDAKTAAQKAIDDAKAAAALEADNVKKTAKTETEAAKKAADDRIIMAEARLEALKAGMVDLDGLKLADLSKLKLKDDGTVEGAEALMTELKTAKPYLFGTPRPGFPPQNPPKPGDLPKLDARALKPEEYAKEREKITRR